MRARAATLAFSALFALGCGGGAGEEPERPAMAAGEALPLFEDVTEAWRLDFVHESGATPEKHLPETMGAGAAIADLDEDGDLDLYLVQGGRMPLPGEPPNGAVNRTYLNAGARFVDATARSGDAAHAGYGMGVAPGDADGDGHLDLYLSNFGPDALLLGDGRARFRDATAASGIREERWTTSAIFFDPDADGDLDLYVCAYVQVDLAAPLWCGGRGPGERAYCHPDAYPGLQDRFWRNRGDGTFDDATLAAGLADSAGKGLGVIALDFDLDGHQDLYVANDSTENRLWRGRGDGSFEDATLLSGTGVDANGATQAGMGVATGDLDGDLDLDLFVTNYDEESNTLYRNDGRGLFTDVTARAGLDAPSRPMVGFGTVAADFDHDGDLDLAVANGHILDNVQLTHDGKRHAQRAQLFLNAGPDEPARFREAPELAADLSAEPFVGRGLYAGDLDGDGRLDLLLTQCGGPARLFRNVGPGPPALVVEGLARGSLARARWSDGGESLHLVGGQSSYLGLSAEALHLGLGGRELVELLVRGPGGAEHPIELPPQVGAEGGRVDAGGAR